MVHGSMNCNFMQQQHVWMRMEPYLKASVYYFLVFDSLQNNTSWKPDACQDCTCHSEVVMCKAAQCQNPQCDFQRVRLILLHDSIIKNEVCNGCKDESID